MFSVSTRHLERICCLTETQINSKDIWKTWRNNDGITSTVRAHLEKFHPEVYQRAVDTLGLKRHDNRQAGSASGGSKEPFSQDRFDWLLVRWVVVDDQVLRSLSRSR